MAKPSVENKHLCKRGFFVIIVTCAHFILLTKYATHGRVGVGGHKENETFTVVYSRCLSKLEFGNVTKQFGRPLPWILPSVYRTHNTIVFSSFKQSYYKTNHLAGFYTKIWFINRVDNVNWPPYRNWKADVSSVSPSSERIDELWVV